MERILAEQRRAAEYVIQNPDGPEVRGASLGIADWVAEEVLIGRESPAAILNTLPERDNTDYLNFLKRKVSISKSSGFEIEDSEIHPITKPHQRIGIQWACRGGRRALFESFGLGKTLQQLEILRLILKRTGGRALIVAPLGVRLEFLRDAKMLGIDLRFVRTIQECDETGIYLTNYETVRDGKLDPSSFVAASLDEAAILRGGGGVKTFREFMRLFESVRFRFVATAIPSPNDYIEMLTYSAFLGVLDIGQAKTRFFKRDSTKADVLTLHPHKVEEFWLWVSSWALFVTKPSDLGFDDTGYDLTEMKVHFHEVKVDHENIVADRDGQLRMFRDSSLGVVEASREKRDSLAVRVACVKAIVDHDPSKHYLIWHDLESERHAIQKAIPEAVSVYGTQNMEEREQAIIDFSEGSIPILSTKPEIAGSGCNFQRYCHTAIFAGIGFKFHDFLQAIHRIHRFLQPHQVNIHIIYCESERSVLDKLLEKWEKHKQQVGTMTDIIKEYGLSELALATALTRSLGVERVEVYGKHYATVNNDTVLETRRMADASVGLVLTSIPFSSQYEYTPSFNDFGHSEDNDRFFEQMSFLSPELMRVLIPGRCLAVHVKDRIVPGGINGLGVQSVYPFHAECIKHFADNGFLYMGMKTIVTDVVRENNQTYRLGWTEQCKDGSKMGYGMPEYLLLFRKPQTDTSKGYGDIPVRKEKKRYSKARWQVDAHGFMRSNGNRPITPEEVMSMPMSKDFHQKMFGMFHDHYLENVYDFEHHVRLGEVLEKRGVLPVTFMLLQPPSWHSDVWTDITRMITLNVTQKRRGAMAHLCLARGTLVLTLDGYKPIEDLALGEMVLTHKGRWRPIIGKACNGVREVARIRAQGVGDLRVTPDHKIWTRVVADKARKADYVRRTEPSWVEASALTGNYVNLKLEPPNDGDPTRTSQEWWTVGRWLADGHIGTRGNIVISCGNHKLKETLENLGNFAGHVHDQGSASQIQLRDAGGRLRKLVGRFGRGATGKVVPYEALALDDEYSRALLDGYLSGDGHRRDDRDGWTASTVSRALALGISMVAARLGIVVSVYRGRRGGTGKILGRTVETHDEWILTGNDSCKRKKPLVLADGLWKKVRSVEPDGTAEVWDIEVEEDASFTAEGCIVKNCPMQMDLADRVITQMSNPGDIVFDPFGGLMTVPMRAVALGRRGIGIELNTQYFLDGAMYCKAEEEKKPLPTLFDLIEAEESLEVQV